MLRRATQPVTVVAASRSFLTAAAVSACATSFRFRSPAHSHFIQSQHVHPLPGPARPRGRRWLRTRKSLSFAFGRWDASLCRDMAAERVWKTALSAPPPPRLAGRFAVAAASVHRPSLRRFAAGAFSLGQRYCPCPLRSLFVNAHSPHYWLALPATPKPCRTVHLPSFGAAANVFYRAADMTDGESQSRTTADIQDPWSVPMGVHGTCLPAGRSAGALGMHGQRNG